MIVVEVIVILINEKIFIVNGKEKVCVIIWDFWFLVYW